MSKWTEFRDGVRTRIQAFWDGLSPQTRLAMSCTAAGFVAGFLFAVMVVC